MNSNEESDTNPSAAPDLWSPPSNGIVKLRYGSEVRRIPVQRLLNDKHQFAYKKLFTLTQDFLSIEHTGFTTKDSNKLPQVVFTYTDDDGDVVTMSSRAEFLEAWQHMGGDVLRLTAVVKGSSSADTIEKETQSEGSSSSSGASSFGGGAANHHDLIAPMTLQSLLETIMAMIAKFIQSIQASANARNESSPSPSNSSSSAPFPSTCNVGVNAAVVTDEIVERIVEEMKNMKQARREAWRAKSLITDPEKLDPSFVHYRHTCDGCGVNPIVGLRYHALNKDNYDLCKACFDANDEKHKDIVFEAQQYNHDAGKCGWRKKKKWEAMKAAAWANANGHPPPPPHHHHGPPPHPHGGPPPHHHHHGPPPPHHHHHGPPPPHHHGPPPPHFGPPPHGKHGMMWAMMQQDLKSAIERSLADVMEKTTSAKDNSKPSDDVEVEVKGKGVEETKTNDNDDNDDISKKNEVNQVEPSTTTAVTEKKMEEEEIIVKAAAADEEGSWNMIDDDHQEDASSPSISATLLARWDTELAALAELGFVDTKAVLDALETLQAANIGCESEEDGVSLQKVVDYLLKQQQQN